MFTAHGRHRFQLRTYVPRHWHQLRSSQAWKYAFYLMTALACGLIVLGAPLLYWINQNYDFFKDLAIHKSPSLLKHLEKEQIWVNSLFVLNALSLLVINVWLVYRIIQKFEGPARALERHLKTLIYGRWNVPELKVREYDEFKSLVDEYNYFYKALQTLTEKEILTLESMHLDRNLKESYSNWFNLLQEKKSRMGYDEIALENTIAAVSSRHWRRAS